MKRNILLSFILSMVLLSWTVYAEKSTGLLGVTAYKNESNTIIRKVTDTKIRWYLWMILSDSYRNARLLARATYYPEYKSEMESMKNHILGATSELIHTVALSGSSKISATERWNVEAWVVSLQKGLVHAFSEYISRLKTSDYKQDANMNFDMKWKDFDFSLQIAPLNSISSYQKDAQSASFLITLSGSTQNVWQSMSWMYRIAVDIKIFSGELFLKAHSFTGYVSEEGMMEKVHEAIDPYLDTEWHFPIPANSREFRTAKQSVDMALSFLSILETKPLFTPYAHVGNAYILEPKKETYDAIGKVLQLPSLTQRDWKNFQKETLLVGLRYEWWIIHSNGFSRDYAYDVRVSPEAKETLVTVSFTGGFLSGIKESAMIRFSPRLFVLNISDDQDRYLSLSSDVWDRLSLSYKEKGITYVQGSIMPKNEPGKWEYSFEGNIPTFDMLVKIYGDISEEWWNFTIERPSEFKELENINDIPLDTLLP